ncbi:hypothetical protein MASSI9I_50225 [Massilia sp. 9I]|nr:hypothetical protein MASSI9I_50225 [Massilia sp. 9I]
MVDRNHRLHPVRHLVCTKPAVCRRCAAGVLRGDQHTGLVALAARQAGRATAGHPCGLAHAWLDSAGRACRHRHLRRAAAPLHQRLRAFHRLRRAGVQRDRPAVDDAAPDRELAGLAAGEHDRRSPLRQPRTLSDRGAVWRLLGERDRVLDLVAQAGRARRHRKGGAGDRDGLAAGRQVAFVLVAAGFRRTEAGARGAGLVRARVLRSAADVRHRAAFGLHVLALAGYGAVGCVGGFARLVAGQAIAAAAAGFLLGFMGGGGALLAAGDAADAKRRRGIVLLCAHLWLHRN